MTEISNSSPVEGSDDDAPRYSGRWAIIAVTLLAVLMASYAWWHHRQAGQRALAFWGPETALLISRAPEVELLELDRDMRARTTHADRVRFGGLPLMAERTKLVQHGESVPGLNKARTILLQDNAFAWDGPAESCQPRWQYALEFRDGERRATVLISLDCPRIKLAGRDGTLSIRPIAAPLGEFLVAQFPKAQFPTQVIPAEKLTTPAAK